MICATEASMKTLPKEEVEEMRSITPNLLRDEKRAITEKLKKGKDCTIMSADKGKDYHHEHKGVYGKDASITAEFCVPQT
ncbi:hypothetical protein Trydic_g11927 [Trypoxylus dichotomus]